MREGAGALFADADTEAEAAADGRHVIKPGSTV
jgi:hypothetical protein